MWKGDPKRRKRSMRKKKKKKRADNLFKTKYKTRLLKIKKVDKPCPDFHL